MEDLRNINEPVRPTHKRKDIGFKATKWIVFTIFTIYGISLLIPFGFMIMNSFKSSAEFTLGNIFGIPKQLYGLNFIEALQFKIGGQSIFSMFCMSILMTILGTVINVGLSACAAYALSKFKFIGRGLIYGLAIFTMVVPIVGTLPAQVKMMETFGLDNSVIGVLFLYSGCFGFNFILLYSSFSSVSNTYLEAASLDGAGRLKTFIKVSLPMVKGPLIACSILTAIGYWNDYTTPLLFMDPSLTTLAVGLKELQTEAQGNYPVIFSSMLIAVIPILVLYLIFQKRIIESTNAGGLKE